MCAPAISGELERIQAARRLPASLLLRNTERDYWDEWDEAGNRTIELEGTPTIRFNDSATMLEAVKAGAGLCLTRSILVRDAICEGSLTQLWGEELHDGLRYYAICAQRSSTKRPVDIFMRWLTSEFAPSAELTS